MSDKKPVAPDSWKALQAPFDADSVSLLPRATGDKDKRHKEKCAECGGYHEFPCIHLSYVGHADITMRLNEVDPEWTWEPMGVDAFGLPALDANGGLWAWLTILGSRKPAYGDPGVDYKAASKAETPDGMKEAIGDMLRNGAMRFGVGTALWSKSDKAKASLYDDADHHQPPAARGGSSPVASTSRTPAPTHDADDPGAYALTFGKHNGLTLAQLDREDHGYLIWLSGQDEAKPATRAAKAYRAATDGVPPVVPPADDQDLSDIPF